jgi:hypothetical protein
MEEPELRRRGKLTCVRTRVPAYTRTVSPRTLLQRSLARSCALAHNLIPSASGERRRRRRRRRAGSAAPARQHGSQVRALVCCAESCVMWNCSVLAHTPCAHFPDGGASPSLPPSLPSSRPLSLARALSAQTRNKEREGDDSDGGARTPCNRAREVQCRTYRVVTGA